MLLAGQSCSWLRRPKPVAPVESNPSDALVFENVSLEQADEAGNLLWRLKATQATYSESGKQAKVDQPRGKLFQGGKEVYEVEAKQGEVNQDGETVFLRQNVRVQDLRDGATIRADEAEWHPQEEVLILRQNVVGTKADLEIKAQEGTWRSKNNEVQLKGAPVLATLGKQRLKLQTENLLWKVAEERVVGDRPLDIQQFAEKDPTQMIRRATSQSGEALLPTQEVILRQAAHLVLTEPPLDIFGDAIRWQTQKNQVMSEAPLRVVHRLEKTTISGDRGQADLTNQVVTMTGNVKGISELRQARLGADRLTWNTASQDVEGTGNVSYDQAEPPLSLSGPTAKGNLNDETMVVSGGQVKTIIIPVDNP